MADPYELDLPVVVGNLKQTLANLIALQTELSTLPKPNYRVHGHDFSWVEMYDFIQRQIDLTTRQISRMEPFEFVSIAR